MKNLRDKIIDQALDDLMDTIERILPIPALIAAGILIVIALWVIVRGPR